MQKQKEREALPFLPYCSGFPQTMEEILVDDFCVMIPRAGYYLAFCVEFEGAVESNLDRVPEEKKEAFCLYSSQFLVLYAKK